MSRKYIAATVSVILIILLLAGCGARSSAGKENSNTVTDTELIRYPTSLDLLISDAPNIYYGTCIEKSVDTETNTAKMAFKIADIYRGSFDGSITEFRSIDHSGIEKGRNCIIFCWERASVFDQTDFYTVGTVIYDKNGTIFCNTASDCSFRNMEEARKYVSTYALEHPFTGDAAVLGDYCRSEDLNDIFEYSSNVFTAEITGDLGDPAPDRTAYGYKLLSNLKGKIDNEQWIVAMNGSMEVGKKYLLLLSNNGGGSSFFVITSVRSVLPLDSDDAKYVLSLAR